MNITLNTLVKDIPQLSHEINNKHSKFEYSAWYKAGKMNIKEFLTESHRIRGFGRAKHRRVIRAILLDNTTSSKTCNYILFRIL